MRMRWGVVGGAVVAAVLLLAIPQAVWAVSMESMTVGAGVREVGDTYRISTRQSTFSPSDEAVYVVMAVRIPRDASWRTYRATLTWYAPDGSEYLEHEISDLERGYIWYIARRMSLRGTRAAQLGGEWTVRFNVRFGPTRTRTFTVEAPATPPPVVTPEPENEPPVAMFWFLPAEPSIRDMVQFTDFSRDPDGEVVRWRWEFGDGSRSTQQSPTHRYTHPGTYTVRLTVTDDEGATGSTTREITVAGAPPVVTDPEVIRIPFESTPPGAYVEIDDIYVGSTPMEYPMEVGTVYSIRISYPGKVAWEMRVRAYEGLVIDVTLPPA